MAKGKRGSTPEDKPARTSFNIKTSTQKKLRYIALVSGSDMSTMVNEALEEIIRKYEKKNGEINF